MNSVHNFESKTSNLRVEQLKVKKDLDDLKQGLKEKKLRLLQMRDQQTKLAEKQPPVDRPILAALKNLLEKSEDLKRKEVAFKAICKEKLTELHAKNEAIKNKCESSDCVESNVAAAESRLAELRERLAEKSRKVGALERNVDDLPSNYELFQYQRRFIELDNQMASEYSQTQQFYSLFNTLEAQKVYISREVSMLNSILESIPKGDSPSPQKEHFLKQLELLVREVGDSLASARSSLQADEERRADSTRDLNGILEYNRQFTLLARDMRKELKKNAFLSTKVNAAAS